MKYRLEATRVTADAYAKMVVPRSLDLTCKTTTLQATAQSLAVSVLDLVATRAGEPPGSAIARSAEGVNGLPNPPWSWSSDAAQGFDASLGPSDMLQNIWGWFGTGPNPGSAAGSVPHLALVPLQWLADCVDATDMRSLWQLLTLICIAAAVGGSLASAGTAKAGFGGYAVAITVGLAVGAISAWAMSTVGDAVRARIRRLLESRHERYFRALYFGAMFWVIIAGFLGGLSSVLLRLVF